MKASELKDLSDDQLQEKLQELQRKMVQTRFLLATNQLTETHQVKFLRKDIARCKTILHHRALNQVSVETGVETADSPAATEEGSFLEEMLD